MSAAYSLHYDASLRALNSFGVAAQTALLARVDTLDAMRAVLTRPDVAALPRLVLGGGSNILFTRDFDGLVLQPALPGLAILREQHDRVIVRAGAGESWDTLVRWSLAQGLNGLENLALIPGWAGAAPIQNIGAYGVEFAEVCSAIEIYDSARDQVRRLDRSECGFAYRHSVFKTAAADTWLVTAIELELTRRPQLRIDYAGLRERLAASGIDTPSASDVAAAVTWLRLQKLPNPALIGNAGSFFQNPFVEPEVAEGLRAAQPTLPIWPAGDGRMKLSAAWLIEQCGLKGVRDGDAGVSAQHALVLVNYGHASGVQLWALAQRVAATVHARFGVRLLAEPVVI